MQEIKTVISTRVVEKEFQPSDLLWCFQTDSTGCATFTMEVSTFTKTEKMLQDRLEFNAHVEEEGTGECDQASASSGALACEAATNGVKHSTFCVQESHFHSQR